MSRLTTPFFGVVLAGLFCWTAPAQPIIEQPSLTLSAAEKIVSACESLAKSKGWRVAIWVLDDNGEPVHMKRMEGAPAYDIQAAQMKAKTSRTWLSSSDPSDPKARFGKAIRAPQGQVVSVLSGSLPEAGGLPIIVDGKLAGTIGVSGAGAGDGQCAQAGLSAILK